MPTPIRDSTGVPHHKCADVKRLSEAWKCCRRVLIVSTSDWLVVCDRALFWLPLRTVKTHFGWRRKLLRWRGIMLSSHPMQWSLNRFVRHLLEADEPRKIVELTRLATVIDVVPAREWPDPWPSIFSLRAIDVTPR